MEEVIIVFRFDEVCFVADNEEDIIEYLKTAGFNQSDWEEDMEMSLQEWLDNGHMVEELTEFLCSGYHISTFELGIDYRSGSPYFMRTIK